MKDPVTLHEALSLYKANRLMRRDMFERIIAEIAAMQADLSVLSPVKAIELEARVAKLEERFADFAAVVLRMQNGGASAGEVISGEVGAEHRWVEVAPDASLDALRARAAELGIDVDKRWGENTLRNKIADAIDRAAAAAKEAA